MSACCSLSRCSASTSCPLLGKGCKPKPLRQRGSQAPCPPPATASAEGAQLNGRPFPATASAEGRQFNGAPSLWERALSQDEGLCSRIHGAPHPPPSPARRRGKRPVILSPPRDRDQAPSSPARR